MFFEKIIKSFKKVLTKWNRCGIISIVVRNTSQATDADLAHLVERDLAKVEVAGSSPVIRSNKWARKTLVPINSMVT